MQIANLINQDVVVDAIPDRDKGLKDKGGSNNDRSESQAWNLAIKILNRSKASSDRLFKFALLPL